VMRAVCVLVLHSPALSETAQHCFWLYHSNWRWLLPVFWNGSDAADQLPDLEYVLNAGS
jgi:hypothetical protein